MSYCQSPKISQRKGVIGRIILAVDTCSPRASLALARDDALLATLEDNKQLPHSQTLFANLEEVLTLAQVDLSQVDFLAGNTGPGSFTGVRVGLAALKGVGQALDRTVIGVDALDLTALAVGFQGSFLVLLEAGRREVYAGLRVVESNGLVKTIGVDLVSDLTSVVERYQLELERGTILVSRIAKHSEELADLARKASRVLEVLSIPREPAGYRRCDDKNWVMHSVKKSLAPTLAIYTAKLLANGLEPELHPHYIRPSDAEINLSIQR